MAQRGGTALSTDQLRALVRSAPRTPGRSEAFIELVAREPQGLNRTLKSLALDPETDQAMRVKAVTALGRKSTPSSLDGLRLAVEDNDETVRFRAIERLGKIGAPRDVTLLEGVRSDNQVTQRALHTARNFLSYRHRLGTHRFDVPEQVLPAENPQAAAIRTGQPTKAMTDRMELLAPPVPGIKVAPRPAARLECGKRELALMMNQEIVVEGWATLTERQGFPAVIVMYNNETGTYEPIYYLTTDPISESEFHILGVRGSGRVALKGTGTVENGSISFEVNATEAPLVHPLTVRGSWNLDSGAVRFGLAVLEPRFSEAQQLRRKQPRPLNGSER